LSDQVIHTIQECTIQEYITDTTINMNSKNYDVSEQKEKERLIVLNETAKNNNLKLNIINTVNICLGVTVGIITIYNSYNEVCKLITYFKFILS